MIFLQEFFGLVTNKSIDIAKITLKLAANGLSMPDKLSNDAETLCAATILYAQKIYDDNSPLGDVSLNISNDSGSTVNFQIPSNGSTINSGNITYLDLNYIKLLAPSDDGVAKQRSIITAILSELDAVGYRFDLSTGGPEADLLTIVANDRDGKTVNVNEMLIKYGVCNYSDTGVDGICNKHKMNDLKNEAIREKRGLAGVERDADAVAAEAERLKPRTNYLANAKKNSKALSNKWLEDKFMDEDNNSTMFKVGDVWLEIPPTNITISQMRNSYTVPLVGMEAKPLSTPTNRTVIKINVVFTADQVYDDMVRILNQFRYCPINMLRSKDLFLRIAGSQSYLARDYSGLYYIPVTMDQYTLFSVDGHPGTVSCVFQFSLFNYSVYIPNNPRGLEYYQHNDNLAVVLNALKNGPKKPKDNDELKQLLGLKTLSLGDITRDTPTTRRLEEASHPYNVNIDDKINTILNARGNDDLYDMNSSFFHIWKIDMDKYFNNMQGIQNKDIDIDNEKNMKDFLYSCVYSNPLFTEKAQSISITYSNVFSWQPVLSQSHPVAQYMGPGETVVSIDLKGIDMSEDYYDIPGSKQTIKSDQKLIGSLLKNWSEKYGTAEYGFFDDRYMIKSTLLNLADVNIVSIQNTVCTSVESKPGLFDVNILFSKSMFEYNLRSNPVSMMDEYFGLQRMIYQYADDPDFQNLSKMINDKIAAAYSTLGSKLANGISLNGMSSGLRMLMNDVFTNIRDTDKVYYQSKDDPLMKLYTPLDISKGKNWIPNKVFKNDAIYQNLTIAINADSYDILPGNSSDQAEEKAKYSAFSDLVSQMVSAQKAGKTIPYGAIPPTFIATDNGVAVKLEDNKEFMRAFFTLFLQSIGQRDGSYQQSGGKFTPDEQVKFVKSMLGQQKKWYQKMWDEGSLSTSAASNHYHFVTKNGIALEFNDTITKEFPGAPVSVTSAAVKQALNKVDAMIKSTCGDKVTQGEWQQTDPTDLTKWYKVILLTAKGRAIPDRKVDDITTNTLASKENKATIDKLKAKAKAKAPLKPFASHRYYPFSEGFVGWSQLTSTTMGAWYVCESEEQTVARVNRMKEASKKAIPWNKDQRLADPNCPNSAALVATIPGMLPYVDCSNDLSFPAAIARPKMMRDMSAARNSNGVIPDIMFNKQGVSLFGEDPLKDPSSTNQTFNTTPDYFMYSDKNPIDKQVDYVDFNGTKVKVALRSQFLDQNATYKSNQDALNKEQWQNLTGNIVDRNFECAHGESNCSYKDSVVSKMVLDNNRKWDGSVVINGQATPAGLVTGDTLAKAGINQFNYGGAISDTLLKASVSTMNINGSYAAARNGDFVRPGVAYLNGKAIDNQSDFKMIPDVIQTAANNAAKGQVLTGDKVANVMTGSHIESLGPTKGIENAFPTYKLYIIQSDTSDYKFSSLDNYWDYRLVQDIMVVHDKDNPVSMLKARVVVDPRYTTVAPDYRFRTGVNSRLYQEEENHTQVPVDKRDTAGDTNIFYKHRAPLRAGMRVCVKMGYHSDPRFLDTVFIGTITQLSGSLDSGLYELSAEGDGRELTVPAVNFSDKFTGENYTDIINAIMRVNPNVIHFGKTYGSFLRRLSYGHKNLAQMGMLGLSAVGAFGVGAFGIAVPGGVAALSLKKTLAFSGSSIAKTVAGRGGGLLLAAGGVAAAAFSATTLLPIAFGEFQQMGQWFNPSFDEFVARNITETDFYQDWKGRTDKTLTVNLPVLGSTSIPALGELDGFFKGNLFNANKMSYQLTKHFYQTYKFGNNPLDDNIFAVDIWNSMTSRASLNITNKLSIWEVLQSIRMLYPNYALDIRPYGSRSTIFLGPVGFNYWKTDDPVQAMLPQLNQMEGLQVDSGLCNKETRRAFDSNSLAANNLGDSVMNLDAKIKQGLDDTKSALGLTRAPFIPFQKHHIITSEEDIILNAMKPTPYRGWNSVIVTYGDDPQNVDPKNMVEFMADTDLYPEAVIKKSIHIDFTKDPETATRYALGFLKQGVEKLYGGTIIVKGNSRIEPYDKVYISDTVNKMYGWVQVETVIHKFDQEMGFTTHIVPNMVCEINNNAYSTTQNIIMSTIYDKYIKNGGWGKVVGNFAIGGAVGLAIGAAGLGASIPVMVGLFAYQAYTAWGDFKDSYQAGKEYTGKFRDMVQADKWRNSEKIIIHDIIAHSIELEATQKGLKYGWALGYMWNKGTLDFLYKQNVTVGGMLNDSFHYFANKVSNSIKATGNVLSSNFGSNSEIVKSWKTGQLSAKAKEDMERLTKGNITKESTGLDEAKLKTTQDLRDGYCKELRSAIDRGDFKTAQGWQDSIVSLDKEFIKINPSTNLTTPENFDLVSRLEKIASAAEESGGVATSAMKAVQHTTTAGWGGAKTVLEKIGRSGIASWMTMGAMEFLPNLGYTFAVKAATKNNVVILSPIFWRDNYLMPSLDGYMANDTFMHIGDMLMNVNNTLEDYKKAALNYLPTVFPIDGSKLNKVKELAGVKSIQAMTSDELNKAGEFVICILKKSGLPEMPTDFSDPKWASIAQYIKTYQNVGGASLAVFMLALLYTENKFKLSGSSAKGAYGLCQIVSPGGYDKQLAINADQILGPVVSSQMKTEFKNGNFINALQCNGQTPSTLPAFINFNIKSMSDIVNAKWNTAYATFYNDPNGRIAKARKASTQGDVMDAVLIYGAYCGYGHNFINDMNNGDYINSNGTVNQSPSQKAKGFVNYSSQQAIWGKNGFLTAYLALRSSYEKCIKEDKNNAGTTSPALPPKTDRVMNTEAKAIKQKIADYAEGCIGKVFTTSNSTKGRAATSRDKGNNIFDCSMFVGDVTFNATIKDQTIEKVKNAVLDIAGYGAGYSSSQAMYGKGTYVDISNAQPGDLIFFRAASDGPVTHVEVFWKWDPATQTYLSIGTSDSKQKIVARKINRTGFARYEARSYFNY